MARNTDGHETPTRREWMKYGGAVVAGGLLTGCTGSDGGDGGGANGSSTTEAGATSAGTESTAGNGTGDESSPTESGDGGSYSVTMSPVGTVEFDSIPEKVAVYDDQWADHMVALGQGAKINSLGFPDFFFQGYYEQLPGVEFDTSGLTALLQGESLDKELFYELDSDVHHLDPYRVVDVWGDNWEQADIEEVETNIGPWFANRYSREQSYEGPRKYEYYTLWELAEKFGQVYQVPDRVTALKGIHDEMVAGIRSKLPPKSQQPSVGLVYFSKDEGTFSPYKLFRPGFGQSHYRPLEATDVFADSDRTYEANYEASYDFEAMLEFDPDVLIQNFGATYPDSGPDSMEQLVYEPLRNHPVGSELSAVKNDRVYGGGSALQGPIYNVFQIEMAAKQLFPEQFGEWKGVGNTPKGEQLFDRERVAAIVNGDL